MLTVPTVRAGRSFLPLNALAFREQTFWHNGAPRLRGPGIRSISRSLRNSADVTDTATSSWDHGKRETQVAVEGKAGGGRERVFRTHDRACSIYSTSVELLQSQSFNLSCLRQTRRPDKTPLVILLATPSLASLVNKENTFIRKILPEIFGEHIEPFEVDLVVAVVDRVSHRHIDAWKKHTIYGSEGLSILVTASAEAAPDLWSTSKQSPGKTLLPSEEHGILSVELYGKSHIASASASVVHTVDIPLAKTLFLNGQTTTLIAQRWVFSPQKGSETRLLCEKSEYIQDLQLRWGLDLIRNLRFEQPPSTILTVPRVVHEAMGNIIRTFRTKEPDSENPTIIPASAELEAMAVNRPKVLEMTRHEIWALILPRERWSGLPQVFGDDTFLVQGYRLHRVLSGGGGWGNKRGLISLDPQSSFRIVDEQKAFDDDQEFDLEQRKVFGEVVRPGDIVRFVAFLQPEDQIRTHSNISCGAQTSPYAQMIANRFSLRLGCVPAFQDKVSISQEGSPPQSQQADTPLQPGEQSSDPDPPPSTEDAIDIGHFGCLSSTGCSIRIEVPYPSDLDPRGTVTNTKIPPLMSLVWNQYHSSTTPPSSSAIQETIPSNIKPLHEYIEKTKKLKKWFSLRKKPVKVSKVDDGHFFGDYIGVSIREQRGRVDKGLGKGPAILKYIPRKSTRVRKGAIKRVRVVKFLSTGSTLVGKGAKKRLERLASQKDGWYGRVDLKSLDSRE